jgi:hypothetical protein
MVVDGVHIESVCGITVSIRNNVDESFSANRRGRLSYAFARCFQTKRVPSSNRHLSPFTLRDFATSGIVVDGVHIEIACGNLVAIRDNVDESFSTDRRGRLSYALARWRRTPT